MYDLKQTGRPSRRTHRGQVTSPHHLASTTALSILRDGGSAVDAAIAADAVLCVVYPHMAGIGGDGFWLIGGDEVRGINASGPAAAGATREYYTERGYESIPKRGEGSALTVPGVVDGWRLAHKEYGNLPWARLFDDAITTAQKGVAITANVAQWIARDATLLAEDETTAAIFLTSGNPPEPGTQLQQPALADSIKEIATSGAREGFYEGPLAQRFCDGLGAESPLKPSDINDYEAEWVDPLSIDYREYTVYSLPPNTQGVAALQLLGLLDGFDVKSWGDGTATYYHHMAEATKIAFADRDAWVTDPTAVDFPADRLLSSSYLDSRRSLIDPQSVVPVDIEPGITPDNGAPSPHKSGGDTCYLSVVDEEGLVVSLIQSIFYDFGSGYVAGETGIIPQNRGSEFSLNRSQINRLEPGKRTFHTLTPALLTQDGEPRLVYGTMGGKGQPQTQAAIISRIVDFDYDVQTAIEAPRWVYGRTWGEESSSLSLEGRIPDLVAEALERRGHRVAMVRDVDEKMGHAAAIRIYNDGTLEGGADPRGDGAAIGY